MQAKLSSGAGIGKLLSPSFKGLGMAIELHKVGSSKGGPFMKYLFAWMLGVPGVVVLAWFLFNHH
jgi:hypothetical protein